MRTLDDLTERQQKAAWAFAKKYGQDVEDVAAYLDVFFKLAGAGRRAFGSGKDGQKRERV